jgi:hypothetical protein
MATEWGLFVFATINAGRLVLVEMIVRYNLQISYFPADFDQLLHRLCQRL